MAHTIHRRPLVMTMLLLLCCALVTCYTLVHATTPQQRRPQYKCHNCTTAPSKRSSSSATEDVALPVDIGTEAPTTPIGVEPGEEDDEILAAGAVIDDPFDPFETVVVVAIALLLVIEGLRWRRTNGG